MSGDLNELVRQAEQRARCMDERSPTTHIVLTARGCVFGTVSWQATARMAGRDLGLEGDGRTAEEALLLFIESLDIAIEAQIERLEDEHSRRTDRLTQLRYDLAALPGEVIPMRKPGARKPAPRKGRK